MKKELNKKELNEAVGGSSLIVLKGVVYDINSIELIKAPETLQQSLKDHKLQIKKGDVIVLAGSTDADKTTVTRLISDDAK